MSNENQPPCPPCNDEVVDDSGLPPGCEPQHKSRCNGDRKNNVWVERGPGANDGNCIGICLLDTMTEDQVIFAVERDDRARADLLRVTTDARLLQIARETPRLPVTEEADNIQTRMNRNHAAASTPFYSIFRGQPPFSQ